MKPATGFGKAALISIIVGAFIFYTYFKYNLALSIVVSASLAVATFVLLTKRDTQRVRRIFLVTFSALVWIGFFLIIAQTGITSLLMWISIHLRVYYLPGTGTIQGIALFPCTREVPQILLGMATYVPPAGFNVVFPDTFNTFMIFMVPYILTALIFGRGFCGWICYFGGITEAFSTGRKERWKLSKFREKITTESGFEVPAGLREDVRDAKYGILLGMVLLSLGTAIPVICMVCWALWLNYINIFWVLIGILLIFSVFLPFMTKKRWWCLICPVGAVLTLLEKINPFRIKIDETKCDKCFDCVRECRMYAMTPQSVEKAKKPNLDCTKCGQCVEVCPKEAVDLYIRGTKVNARQILIPLSIAVAAAWYAWFIVAIFMLLPRFLGF